MNAVDSAVSCFVAQHPASHYYLAFSGGLDSTVLLHALSRIAPAVQVTAIHVHHGLLPEADAWVEHCQSVCQKLNISCNIHKANLQLKTGDSVEEIARKARYSIFEKVLAKDDVLLTAHHADDQAETFLLNALRGSGSEGLAAMPAEKHFALGVHCRPLLALTRQQLSDYATVHKLSWVEDPSNKDDRFNRNYLRQHIMPALQQRWPQMATTLSRSAGLSADSIELLSDLACLDTGIEPSKPSPLAISNLQHLSQIRRFNALRYWLKQYLMQTPSMAILTEVDNAMFARQDAVPEIAIGNFTVCRYQQMLYCFESAPSLADEVFQWDITQSLIISQQVTLEPHMLGTMLSSLLAQKAILRVCFRQGGERILLPGRKHQHQVKKLLQERGVPPWLRDRLPMIYYQDRLIAILGLSPPILGQL